MIGRAVTPYLIGGAGIGLMALLGVLWFLWSANGSLRTERDTLKLNLLSCNARVENITEDRKSDATVTDPRTFDVPDGWLMPNTTSPD